MWYNFFGDIMLIDSHCHILSSEYENVDDVLSSVFKSETKKIILSGFDVKSSVEAIKIASKNENVYASIGIGPENIDDYSDDNFKVISDLAKCDKVVAIGEIGLDYYWTTDNKDKQKLIFSKMLQLAKDNKLPVVIHSRDSIYDTYELLKKYKVNGIMHCYSGSYEMARKFIDLGFLIGVGGIVTFKNSKKIKEIVEKLDLCNISLETDSPYLTPEPYRGIKNTPCNISLIASKIAEIKSVSFEEVSEITGHNVMAKFDL